jgi:hypothetical protein
MDNGNEMRDFLISRRARITPERAGLPAYGGNRRVARLRQEEVALLAGVSRPRRPPGRRAVPRQRDRARNRRRTLT